MTGTPTASGTFSIKVTDAKGVVATTTCSITIKPAPLSVCCAAVTTGEVGVAFNSGPITVTGGTAPYTYSIVGTLPAGLTLNASTGAVTGTPTASGTFQVKVTDANGATGTSCAITINAAISVTCAAVNAGTIGVIFNSGPITVTGGTGPYTYSIVGTLPAGLTLNTSTGAVTGTPTASGTFSVKVTDAKGATGTSCVITIITDCGCTGYTLSVNPSSVTVVAGQSATTTFTFTPYGGFVGTVGFSCTDLPAGAICTFVPPTVTADGSNTVQTSKLTITTTASGTAVIAQNRTTPGPTLAGMFLLPGLLLGGFIAWRRRSFTARVRGMLLLLLVGTVLAGGAIGCGGPTPTIAPVSTNVVTVKATTTASSKTSGGSSSTQTATFTLTILQ